MIHFLKKPYHWATVYTCILMVFVLFVMLDTFVIPRAGTSVPTVTAAVTSTVNAVSGTSATASTTDSDTETTAAPSAQATSVVTETSYSDENIQITITTMREYDTTYYVADIQLSSAAYLKTAFAKSTYGRNIKETTSAMAEDNNAIFAINGDYYGFRNIGYVIRNGVLYRDSARESGDDEALVIDSLGNLSIIEESQTDAQSLIDAGVQQVLSFGPALINDGVITVDADSEVSQSMTSNPRTAIGQISELHYIVIVSDGRTDESTGLSLLELAQVMKEQGCVVAYNLDGGGSSTMWFNGQVVNNPANGKSSSERSVSDIVYIGY